MAYMTYKLLKYYREIDEERIRRKMIDKLFRPLIIILEKISFGAERLSIPEFLPIKEGDNFISILEYWPNLEKEHPYLVYKLPKSLKENIEGFFKDLEKFINLQNQCFRELNQIIVEEIKKEILEKIKKETRRDNLMFGPKGTYYSIEIGGKRFRITFHELLFADQTLEEYIEKLKEDPTLPNKEIGEECFIGDEVKLKELNRKNFQEIANNILKKLNKDPKLKKFLYECRKLKENAEELRQNLSQEAILKSDCEPWKRIKEIITKFIFKHIKS